ncbi:MAG: response regulator [Candidatus Neomarinimicrobiota bacterium]
MKSKLNSTKPNSKTVLVIDDEVNICEFFIDLFTVYGVNVDVAYDGDSGLKKALNNPYSVIFLDVKLGRDDGIEVLKKIMDHNPKIHVIMISAYLKEDVIEQAIRYGADGYLNKPLTVRDVISMVFRFIR